MGEPGAAMFLTEGDDASCIETVDAMEAAIRSLAAEGLPAARDAEEARAVLERRLLAHGIDFRNDGTWLFLKAAVARGWEAPRLTAMRRALDMHACVPRDHADAFAFLEDGISLVARHLRPTAGMEAYLIERAQELAAGEVRRARAEPARLGRLLGHARSMDDPDTFRLPFATTLPAAEAFECLRGDGVALHRFGAGMGGCPSYHTALLRNRDIVAAGVATGLRSLFDQPGLGGIDPARYIEHFRGVLSDGMWGDGILAMLDDSSDAPGRRHRGPHVAPWLTALSRLRGWSADKLDRLLARDDLLQDHPGEFLMAAMKAIEHVATRDAIVEVRAVLVLLRMVGDRPDARSRRGANGNARQCREWVAGLRRGRDLLWLDGQLRDRADGGPESPMPSGEWAALVSRRLADDGTLARGALLHLMAMRDPRSFHGLKPLIEGLLLLRDENRLLWRLALGEDGRLRRRAGMFILGIIGGRIRTDGRGTVTVQGLGAGPTSPGMPAKSLFG